MTESTFIKNRQPSWKEFEAHLDRTSSLSPDDLAEHYLLLSDDLSYARTFFPGSKMVPYLNGLAMRAHQMIYKNKREEKGRFIKFWKYEVPLAIGESHKPIFYALVIFCLAIFIGALSTHIEPEYLRTIVGDSYVNMTEENIANMDPMAVYKGESGTGMFFMISTNNIRVSFMAFVLGILGSIPTALLLFYNGVMVGAFITFFAKKGIFGLAFTTIMIHGTYELSAIVIAGGAGLVLGNSLLFPGTYTRRDSLIKGAKNSLKIIIGLVPIFILAALLESYVTRHYLELGMIGRIAVMLISAISLYWYIIYYPQKIKSGHYE